MERGRASFERRRWGDAYAELAAADAEQPLAVEDVERLAAAAYLLRRHEDSVDAWVRAHQEHLRRADPARAARCAFWLWFGHMNRGEMAQAGGWIGRARTIVDECRLDCVEQGYVRLPDALGAMFAGDPGTACPRLDEIVGIAERFKDADLLTLGRMARGQCLVYLGQAAEGTTMLDEVMVGLTTSAVSPAVAGMAYCAVIETCWEIFDMRRAQEWTVALTRWCNTQPDLVPYRGQCLVHRAELMRLRGEWPDAIAEAVRAEELLALPPAAPAAGQACYEQAEVYRLLGQTDRAEEAYHQASQWGFSVQPGLALLRLSQGQHDAAVTSIRVAVDEAGDMPGRSRLLPACVEILLAADEVAGARQAANELNAIAEGLASPFLVAVSAHAEGAVALAESDPRAALAALRRAWAAWRDLDAPYEGARVRVLIGQAYALLADADSAEMEFDAARLVFQELGAVPDLARLRALMGGGNGTVAAGSVRSHALTGREIELLTHLATGKTNKAIAAELIISEKTVARHVANIFTKLGLSSRAAATAYAYEHGLVERRQR